MDQLASVFTDIFNLSLTESVIPTCFKQPIIVPVPKEVKVTCLNDSRNVALTSVSMKFINKLRTLGLNTSLCNWSLDFLTDRPSKDGKVR